MTTGQHTLGSVDIVGPEFKPRGDEYPGREVWYLGDDYERFLELRVAFEAVGRCVRSGDETNTIAARLAVEIFDLDSHVASGFQPISWISSDLAGRNAAISSLYADICRGVMLIEAARGGDGHLAIVDEGDFGSALAQLCRDNAILACWHGAAANMKRWLTALRRHAGFCLRWLWQRHALRGHWVERSKLASRNSLLVTWSDGSRDTGSDADRFFGYLPQWLRGGQHEIGWLLNPIGWMAPMGDIAAAAKLSSENEPTVLTSEFFSFSSLVRAYIRLFTFRSALKPRAALGGIDLTSLVRLARWRELASPRLVYAAVYSGLARAMKRAGVAPRALIYTYENQPWEKAMLAGFRRDLPDTLLIGVQHGAFAPRDLSGYPSRTQWGDGTAPDRLMTVGPEFRDRLLSLSAPADRVVVGGALRYAAGRKAVSANRQQDAQKAALILTMCSLDPRESFELSHKAMVATASLSGVRLVVKFHPVMDPGSVDSIRARLAKLGDMKKVEVAESNTQDWLARADVALYSSSGIAFDIAGAGVPMIHVGSDVALDMDNFLDADIPRCRSPEQLRTMIDELLTDQTKRRSAIDAARDYLERSFTIPDPQVWLDILQTKKHGASGAHL